MIKTRSEGRNDGPSRMKYRMSAMLAAVAVAVAGLPASPPASAAALAQYRTEIRNDLGKCNAGDGPAVLVTVEGVKASTGTLRIQSYRANASDWLGKGKWINRIEVPARAGRMSFCLPVPGPGTYGIAVRHDVNGNGETDIRSDGGGMSNNPSINIFNLGKPSYTRVGVPVTGGVKPIRIEMKYM